MLAAAAALCLSLLIPAAGLAAEGPNALLAAIADGDAAKVKSALDGGASANSADEEGATALMLAAATGNVEVVKLLLDKGAEVDKVAERQGDVRTPRSRLTAVLAAAHQGRDAVVKLLIERGADVKVRDGVESTPLIWLAGNSSCWTRGWT
jgi:ankyrin repeat protein